MKDSKVKKLVLSALFAALCCVSTMVLQIPSPMSGYVNLGDCFVLLSGWILGPIYGTAAAGIGSMLADMLTGYMHYAPGTLVIKGATALTASLLYIFFCKALKNHDYISRILSGVAGEAVMVLGYFGYAGLLLGKGLAAAASIPGNIAQGAFGIITSFIVMSILTKNKLLEKFR